MSQQRCLECDAEGTLVRGWWEEVPDEPIPEARPALTADQAALGTALAKVNAATPVLALRAPPSPR